MDLPLNCIHEIAKEAPEILSMNVQATELRCYHIFRFNTTGLQTEDNRAIKQYLRKYKISIIENNNDEDAHEDVFLNLVMEDDQVKRTMYNCKELHMNIKKILLIYKRFGEPFKQVERYRGTWLEGQIDSKDMQELWKALPNVKDIELICWDSDVELECKETAKIIIDLRGIWELNSWKIDARCQVKV